MCVFFHLNINCSFCFVFCNACSLVIPVPVSPPFRNVFHAVLFSLLVSGDVRGGCSRFWTLLESVRGSVPQACGEAKAADLRKALDPR